MAKDPEPHTLQPDPPEGDPAVIDRELARQDEKARAERETPAKDGTPKAG